MIDHNMSMLSKYKAYFESSLNISIEQIAQSNGIVVSSSVKRYVSEGLLYFTPVYAFETDNAIIVSCIPEWENEIVELLTGIAVTDAIAKMKGFTKNRKRDALADSHYILYGLDAPNPQINYKNAVLLDYSHYSQYWAFCKETHPLIYECLDTKKAQINRYYRDMVEKSIHFCVIVDGAIVSSTRSEGVPHRPKGIINLGINTLNEHRRNGYAAATCAAFIRHNGQKGLMPIWLSTSDNIASHSLAKKLGFRHLGNVYSLITPLESWKA